MYRGCAWITCKYYAFLYTGLVSTDSVIHRGSETSPLQTLELTVCLFGIRIILRNWRHREGSENRVKVTPLWGKFTDLPFILSVPPFPRTRVALIKEKWDQHLSAKPHLVYQFSWMPPSHLSFFVSVRAAGFPCVPSMKPEVYMLLAFCLFYSC